MATWIYGDINDNIGNDNINNNMDIQQHTPSHAPCLRTARTLGAVILLLRSHRVLEDLQLFLSLLEEISVGPPRR